MFTSHLGPLIVLLCVSLSASDTPPRASLSHEELREKLFNAQERIEGIRIRYRATSLKGNDRTGAYLLREFAAKRPFYFYHHGAHGDKDLAWEDDPSQQKAWVLADKYYNEFPLKRLYFYAPWKSTDVLPGSLQKGEVWFQVTGCWPLKSREPPRLWGIAPLLREVASSSEYSAVWDHLEKVEDRWCHVLAKGELDKLWIDVDRGCCVMRREVIVPLPDQTVYCRVELSQHKEMEPGIWLPCHIRHQQCLGGWDVPNPRINCKIEVLEMSVNDVSDEQFVFSPRPGSVSFPSNVPDQIEQTETGGLDYLDDLVSWIGRVYGPCAPVETGYRAIAMVLPYVVVALSVGIVVAAEISRYRTDKRSNRPVADYDDHQLRDQLVDKSRR